VSVALDYGSAFEANLLMRATTAASSAARTQGGKLKFR